MPKAKICRIAIRQEGDVIKGYIALADTMDKAIVIGTLEKVIADHHPQLFESWKLFMQHAIEVFLKDNFGLEVDHFREETVPEVNQQGIHR